MIDEVILEDNDEFMEIKVREDQFILYGGEVMAHLAVHEEQPQLYRRTGEDFYRFRVYKLQRGGGR